MSEPRRELPNILITGVPGTGKTTLAEMAASLAALNHLNVSHLVSEERLHEGRDEEFDSLILNEDKLLDYLEDEQKVNLGGFILDFHSCELFPERWIDLVIVLQTDNAVLFDRLSARGYNPRKIQENIEAEIMQVVVEEASQSYAKEIVHVLSSNSIEDLEHNCERIVQWIASYSNRVRNFIDGELRDSVDKNTVDIENPATDQVVGSLPKSNLEDVELAVVAATKAFSEWSETGYGSRAVWLERIALEIEKNLDEFALLESADTGKPLNLCRNMDIPRAAANFRFFAGAVRHSEERACMMDDGSLNYTHRAPIGVVGLITPWNLPLYLLSWKIAPALAMGNTIVAKPSEITSLTAFRLAQICIDIGLPKGVLNIVFGLGAEAGAAIVSHPKIRMISFTGGTATGRRVASIAAPMFKKTSLELGGKNASIVFADCDFDKAVQGVMRAAFLNQGQICLSGSRIFVESSIYQAFVDALVTETQKITVGDPASSWMGSVISKQHLDKIKTYVELAQAEGGHILVGGKSPQLAEPFKNGAFFQPTIIANLSPYSRCASEEIFGPVVSIHKFEHQDEVIEYHDSVEYGLAGSVWTRDLKKAHDISRRMNTGMVWVNCWLKRDLRVPFGGVKNSGIGIEGGMYSLETYSQTKNICISS